MPDPAEGPLAPPQPTRLSTEPGPAPVSGPGWVRRLQAQDLQACLDLDIAVLGGFWSESQWLAELQGEARLCLGLQALQQPQQAAGAALLGVACGWLVVDELHITLVAVHPMGRRRGLGRQLLEALLVAAGREGALHATLEVASGNQAALALYGACAFQTAGTRRDYYRDGQDALIQWKRIAGPAPGGAGSDGC